MIRNLRFCASLDRTPLSSMKILLDSLRLRELRKPSISQPIYIHLHFCDGCDLSADKMLSLI